MWIAALTSVVAVVSGAALALSGIGARAMVPLRSFALAAVVATVVAHLLPEALAEGGAGVLVVFALAAIAPALLARVGSGHGDHDLPLGPARGGGFAVELAYASLLLHKVTDGVALGTAVGASHDGHDHWDVVLAVGGHTIPMAATVALAFLPRGARIAWLRTLGLAAAMLAGALLADIARRAGSLGVAPWLNAVASGLLLHVVIHDLPAPGARPAVARLAELAAIGIGVALPVVAGGHGHEEPLAALLGGAFADLALRTAPLLAVGLVAGALIQALATPRPLTWIDGRTPFAGAVRGALAGAPVSVCSCGVLPVAGALERRGVGVAAMVAFAVATPSIGPETIAITAQLLGWPLALVRAGGALAVAVVVALAAARVVAARRAHRHHHHHGHADHHHADHHHGHTDHQHSHDDHPHAAYDLDGTATSSRGQRFLTALDDALVHTGPWVLAGLIVAAYAQVLIGAGALADAPLWLDAAIIAVLAVPSYGCAAAATPLAAVLVARGLAPSIALAGLLLGPIASLATVRFLQRALGTAATATGVALGAAVIAALAVTVETSGIPAAPAPTTPDAVSWAAAALLLALAARTVWRHGLASWVAALHGHHEPHE
jgi:uncharacterized protein